MVWHRGLLTYYGTKIPCTEYATTFFRVIREKVIIFYLYFSINMGKNCRQIVILSLSGIEDNLPITVVIRQPSRLVIKLAIGPKPRTIQSLKGV